MKEVYALLEPEIRTVRYIGLAQNAETRLKSHWHQRNSAYRSPVKDWLRSLSAAPEYYVLQVVEDEHGIQAEQYWTELLRQTGLDLLNRRDGYRVRPETRIKISESSIGKVVSTETREKLRQATAGKPRSPEVCQQISERRKRECSTPEGLAHMQWVSDQRFKDRDK